MINKVCDKNKCLEIEDLIYLCEQFCLNAIEHCISEIFELKKLTIAQIKDYSILTIPTKIETMYFECLSQNSIETIKFP